MNKRILISIIASIAIIAIGCTKTEIPDAVTPGGQISLSLDGTALSDSQTYPVYRGENVTFSFTYNGLSKVVAECPEGWSCAVSMSNKTVTVTAPVYTNSSAASTAKIKLLLYDGTGSEPGEQIINVSAEERSMDFSITDPSDLTGVLDFSIGSQKSFTFVKSESVKDLLFTLPEGWKAEVKDDATFIVTAPDFSEAGTVANGTITVTPVSWSGQQDLSLVKNINVHVSYNATFQFKEKEISFKYGETKTIDIIAKGLKSFTVPELPAGWSGDFSNLLNGSITLTAPSENSTLQGADSLRISGVSISDEAIASSPVYIRLYGINSLDEFLAFRTIYGATENTPVLTGLDKYLVNGGISLNSDISLPESAMASIKAYFIKNLNLPFNGNYHTMTVDFTSNLPVCAIFQYSNGVTIRNLNLKGTISNVLKGASSNCAGLVAIARDGSVFENVTSDISIRFNAMDAASYNSNVGGIAASLIGAVIFRNCKVRGDINIETPVRTAGGISGITDTSKPGALETFEDCEFAGTLSYSQNLDCPQNVRIGGIVGDFARQGKLTRCKFSGKMLFDLNGFKFITSDGRGVGGLLGKITAPVSGYTMKADLVDCTSSGTITVKGISSADVRNDYQLVIGSKPAGSAAILTETGTVLTGTISFE